MKTTPKNIVSPLFAASLILSAGASSSVDQIAQAMPTTGDSGEETTISDGFDDLTNAHGWQWGTGNEVVVPVNGHPGAHLADGTFGSAVPMFFTTAQASPDFTGDYRDRGVESIGVDLVVKDSSFPIGARPLTLLLTNDNGTPGNYEDDLWVWFTGDKEVPQAGVPIGPGAGGTPAGWADFDFVVPASETTVPDGWEVAGVDGMSDDDVWNGVMTDVDSVEFWYGVPGTIYLVNSWDVGADNVRITIVSVPSVPGDLNGDGIIDVFDLRLLVHQFGPCDGCPADLNGDGVVNVLDLWMLLRLMNVHFPLSLGSGT